MENSKKAVMTSSKQHFQNFRKVSSQFYVKTMWSKFLQNQLKLWKLKTTTDRQTHRQTDKRTHRQGSSLDNIFTPEMTEYKKCEKWGVTEFILFLLALT